MIRIHADLIAHRWIIWSCTPGYRGYPGQYRVIAGTGRTLPEARAKAREAFRQHHKMREGI